MNVAVGYGYSVYFTRLENLLKAKTERIRRHFPRKPSISPFFRRFHDPFSRSTKPHFPLPVFCSDRPTLSPETAVIGLFLRKSGFRSCHPRKTGGNDAEKIHPIPVHASGRKKTGGGFRRVPDRFFRLLPYILAATA